MADCVEKILQIRKKGGNCEKFWKIFDRRIPADYVISEGDNLVKSPQI